MSKNKTLIKLTALFAFLTAAFGTLLHFVYEWSGKNLIVGIFSPVNESIWEHLKILFIPYLIFTLIEYPIYAKRYKNYFYAKCSGVILGLISIIVLYFTYSGIIGKNIDWVNVIIFLISVALSYGVSMYMLLFCERKASLRKEIIAGVIFILIFILFAIFTFYPPQINLFEDPKTFIYGI